MDQGLKIKDSKIIKIDKDHNHSWCYIGPALAPNSLNSLKIWLVDAKSGIRVGLSKHKF